MLRPVGRTYQQEEKPECFGAYEKNGVPLWDARSPECAGGLDPTFRNQNDGTSIRPPCDFFKECGNSVGRGHLIPANHLVKQERPRPGWMPPVVSTAPTVRTPQPAPQAQVMPQAGGYSYEQLAQMYAYLQNMLAQVQATQAGHNPPRNPAVQPQVQYMPPQVMPHMMAPTMQQGFQQMMPVNHYMPTYLTQAEPEGSFGGRLIRELFRSLGKAAGHSIAHFFDNNPLK